MLRITILACIFGGISALIPLGEIIVALLDC
jgi:hypothetical protein